MNAGLTSKIDRSVRGVGKLPAHQKQRKGIIDACDAIMWGSVGYISEKMTPPAGVDFRGIKNGAALLPRKQEASKTLPKKVADRMIIPVSFDKAAQAEAEGAGGADGKDGQAKPKGVCVPEWSMVELQGELVSKDPMSGQPLGSMTYENVSRTACVARGVST